MVEMQAGGGKGDPVTQTAARVRHAVGTGRRGQKQGGVHLSSDVREQSEHR